jgi:hypothetical protein
LTFIAPNFSHWLNQQFKGNPASIVSTHQTEVGGLLSNKLQRVVNNKPLGVRNEGLGGRIAIHAAHFKLLGGYDEKIEGWGPDDLNFTLRARDAGLCVVDIPSELYRTPLAHSDGERLVNLSPEAYKESLRLMQRGTPKKMAAAIVCVVRSYEAKTNEGNVGCGEVRLNFNDKITTIKPLRSASLHKHACVDAGASAIEVEKESAFSPRADWAESFRTSESSTPARPIR